MKSGTYERTPQEKERLRNMLKLVRRGPNTTWSAAISRGHRSKHEQHHEAECWSLRSPCGRVFQFKNLTDFVREHSDLFSPEQLAPGSGGLPRAVHALGKLSPRKKHPQATGYGWTWHVNGEVDPLGRDAL